MKEYVDTAVDSLTLAFEMLLKAAIDEQWKKVKFSGGDRSFDLGRCVTVGSTS